MISLQVATLVCFVCVVKSQYAADPYAPVYADTPPKYNFDYQVQDKYSGNNFGHTEDRDGYNTKGRYSVQLPDGRLQNVDYNVVGDNGYLADVQYTGEAQYPPPAAYAPYNRRRR